MSTFTWLPDKGATCTREPRVLSVKFGDTYEERRPDGINNDMRVWNVSFSARILTEVQAIDEFLGAAGGVTAFTWTDPKGFTGLFICRKWSGPIAEQGNNAITATFEQVPA